MNDVFIGNPFGGAYSAPYGTTLPTDAVTDLDNAFVELGLISDEGYADSDQRTIKDQTSYTSNDPTPFLQSRTEAFQLTLLETNEVVLREAYGDANVTVDTDGSIAVTHRTYGAMQHRSYVFDTITGNRVRRQVIPCGAVTELGEITNSRSEPLGYDLTIRAIPDNNGVTAYTYIATIQ